MITKDRVPVCITKCVCKSSFSVVIQDNVTVWSCAISVGRARLVMLVVINDGKKRVMI